MGKAAEVWRSHVSSMVKQGLTADEYAEKNGLVVGTLKWWRSQLRKEIGPRSGKNQFVALSVRPTAPASMGTVRVTVGGGVHVDLPGLPAPQWLAALARSFNEAR